MKKYLLSFAISFLATIITYAQKLKANDVPVAVRSALQHKYPDATNVYWEKENANYEANWGGKSHEDNSAQFTPAGEFIEYVQAIPISELPKEVSTYVKSHYKGAKITEAGRVTNALGKTFYEAEVKKKDIVFDENGNFVRVED